MATTKQAARALKRSADNDFNIMYARVQAKRRGATPAEVERNVMKIQTRTTWDKEPVQLGRRDWDRGVSVGDFARGEL